jgi:hypothetical protein
MIVNSNMSDNEKARKYETIQASNRKSQKTYQERRSATGEVRATIWVKKGKEQAIALPKETTTLIARLSTEEQVDLNKEICSYCQAVTGQQTLGNGWAVPFTRLVRLEQIKLHEDFRELFPLVPENLEKIVERMKVDGYDSSQPLQVWNSAEGLILVDGHQRWLAALEIGITEVPCYLHDFGSLDEALEYAVGIQMERRNLSDADRAIMLPVVKSLKQRI